MTYNIHPLLVHFPIALLFIYSLMKIVPLRKWFPRVAWRDTERVFLLLGFLGACAALLTGDTAEHLVRPNRQVVEYHSTFATLSTYIYGALLLGEIAAVANMRMSERLEKLNIKKITVWIERILCNPIFALLLSIIGLVAISLTGMLGGIMAYGTSADPLSAPLLKLLGISF